MLDNFRTICGQIVFSDPSFTSTTACELGGDLYDKALSNNNSCILLAFADEEVAAELMNSLVDWAKQQQASAIRLETDASLKRAHKFYEKFGFKHYAKAYNMNLQC